MARTVELRRHTDADGDVLTEGGVRAAVEIGARLRGSYDVVITDLHLTPHRCAEGMNVLTRARRLNPGATIVMLTAYTSEGSEQEAYRNGVNLYETKPVGLAKLAACIEAARDGSAQPSMKSGGEWGRTCPE